MTRCLRPRPWGPSWVRAIIIGLIVGTLSTTAASAAERLVLLPETIALSGPVNWQQLVVERQRDGKYIGPVEKPVQFETDRPDVVEIVDGEARAVGNGAAIITARVGDEIATTSVSVSMFEAAHDWSFRNHVESVLSKSGCNSGACHGAAAGKNGFRLSLRGYDPQGDFLTITRQALGRRIVPSDPGRSLLLTKPTGAVAHKGGLRFRVGSREYQAISEWIAAATPAPQESDVRLLRLEISPPGVILKPDDQQQFLLLAHFSDGHVEDVTRWGKYTSTDETVASVDDAGMVQVAGYGEGAITAWYLSKVVAATVTSPFDSSAAPIASASDSARPDVATSSRRGFIDGCIDQKLADLNIPASPLCDDATFVRRAYVDTIGVLPTAAEAKAFLADESDEKRAALIEQLLNRPEFVDYWAYKWSDLLLVRSDAQVLTPEAMWSYYRWIRNHVEANTPWDEIARELITARGDTLENGAANFFVLHKDPSSLAETTTVALLGTSINCAKCHNHPLEKWTNNQYYAFANLFARVRVKDGGSAGSNMVFSAESGDLTQPLTGKPQPPTPLDAAPLDPHSAADRREALAEWLTSAQNPYFSRAITNRIWANYMGVGLVEMVDDMRLTNPPSNAELLAACADYLAEHDFDLKALMRVILQSNAYQRASVPLAENAAESRFYSRYYPRRMMAEVLLDAMSQVTAAPTKFAGYPAGWRAIQLPDSSVESYFLQAFGRPDRTVTCECERTNDPSMAQVLHLANGASLNDKLAVKSNRLGELIATDAADSAIIEEAYLSALSRYPTAEEASQLADLLEKTPADQKRAAVEDLYWSILSSREFLFNH